MGKEDDGEKAWTFIFSFGQKVLINPSKWKMFLTALKPQRVLSSFPSIFHSFPLRWIFAKWKKGGGRNSIKNPFLLTPKAFWNICLTSTRLSAAAGFLRLRAFFLLFTLTSGEKPRWISIKWKTEMVFFIEQQLRRSERKGQRKKGKLVKRQKDERGMIWIQRVCLSTG